MSRDIEGEGLQLSRFKVHSNCETGILGSSTRNFKWLGFAEWNNMLGRKKGETW